MCSCPARDSPGGPRTPENPLSPLGPVRPGSPVEETRAVVSVYSQVTTPKTLNVQHLDSLCTVSRDSGDLPDLSGP